MAKKQFKSESKRLLDLMINSIYTNKDIFLREIISNASDAIDKLFYISLTDERVGMSREDFRIRIFADKDKRTITVSDNGVGMTAEDMEKNLGVIAHSGSLQFKQDNAEAAGNEIDIIGQFGVGFYSAFMVSDDVTVVSRAYGSDKGFCWHSTGADGYTVTECDKDAVGTDVVMHIKPDAEGEHYSDYLENWKLRELIKKYSDYVRWPIVMDVEETKPVEKTDESTGETKTEYVTETAEQTINTMVPIWQRSKSDVSEADCVAYYKEQFHDVTDPVAVVRVSAEGAVSYKAMLFIPETVPYDFYSREYEAGLRLYSNGVLIMDKCADLLPECFRFVRGVVDSPDLSLNISRELLQHDRQIKVIAANLEKKIRSELMKLLENSPEKYRAFFKNYGTQLKYGMVANFGMKKDMLRDLILFYSSMGSDAITLKEYAAAMPESQSVIYYAAAGSMSSAAALPQTEEVRSRGLHILYLTEPVDEFVIEILGEYDGKKFCNVASDDLGLETEEEKAETTQKEDENRPLLDFVKQTLGDRVVSVRLSHRLKSFPACLATEGEITLEMEKYFRTMPGAEDAPMAKRVLELNGEHRAFDALKKAYDSDRDRAAAIAKILYSQALLAAGLPLEDNAEYTELVCSML
ncbi:MAG TPA: molecular chaperone HtpG [Firmicutes bacterium]|nr:molecular chaperone HtpG [Bacillota bacterium]